MEQLVANENTVQTKKLSQKEAIYQLAQKVLSQRGESSEGSLKLTKDERSAVKAEFINMIERGEVELKKQKQGAELKKYASCAISNWLKKDSRYNQ